jgi:hypothetical protein
MAETTGRDKAIMRQLYHRTKHMPYFSINDFRNKHNPNEIDPLFTLIGNFGDFVNGMRIDGYVVKKGMVRARHGKAKGREVGRWVWTVKAHGDFNK